VVRPCLALLVVALVCGLPGSAAATQWTEPQTLAGEGGVLVGIDGGGDVLLARTDFDAGNVLTLRHRGAGSSGFGPEQVIGRGLNTVPTLKVTESGQAGLLYDTPEGCTEPTSCTYGLRLRTGNTKDGVGEPVAIAGHVGGQAMAVNDGGDVAVAWQTERFPLFASTTSPMSRLRVRLRTSGSKTFSAPIDLSHIADGSAGEPSVAMNGRGDTVVAWSQLHPPDRAKPGWSSIYVSYRRAGGTFGPAQAVWQRGDAFSPLAAIDSHGDATILLDHEGGKYAVRTEGGTRFGRATRVLSPSLENTALASGEHGVVALAFSSLYGRARIARADDGHWFEPEQELVPGVGWSNPDLDANGNLIMSGATAGFISLPYIGIFSRFGFAPIDVTQVNTGPHTFVGDLAANDHGAAVATFGVETGPNKQRVVMVEHPGDWAPPAMTVGPLQPTANGFTARVSCSEACRVTGGLQARQRGAAAAAAPAAAMSGARTLKARTTAKLTVKLSRKAARKLKKQLRAAKGRRLQAVVKARDTFGNARTRRFKASSRVLR
jgi:hypothetical protein